MKTETVCRIAAPFSDKNVIGLRDMRIVGAKVREGAVSGRKPRKLGGV